MTFIWTYITCSLRLDMSFGLNGLTGKCKSVFSFALELLKSSCHSSPCFVALGRRTTWSSHLSSSVPTCISFAAKPCTVHQMCREDQLSLRRMAKDDDTVIKCVVFDLAHGAALTQIRKFNKLVNMTAGARRMGEGVTVGKFGRNK